MLGFHNIILSWKRYQHNPSWFRCFGYFRVESGSSRLTQRVSEEVRVSFVSIELSKEG